MKTLYILFILLGCFLKLNSQTCNLGNCENGQGTYTFANGDKYVGEWEDDEFMGK